MVVALGDVKSAAKASGRIKWQERGAYRKEADHYFSTDPRRDTKLITSLNPSPQSVIFPS